MKLLVVCLGNICRSPLAEGAFRRRIAESPLADQVQVDSAGTGDWHVGQPPDPRAIECARRHGVDIGMLRGRQVTASDFEAFDWLLCADSSNVRDVLRMAPSRRQHKVALLMDWAGLGQGAGIPDPYAGNASHFEEVWHMVDAAAQTVVGRLCQTRDSGIIR